MAAPGHYYDVSWTSTTASPVGYGLSWLIPQPYPVLEYYEEITVNNYTIRVDSNSTGSPLTGNIYFDSSSSPSVSTGYSSSTDTRRYVDASTNVDVFNGSLEVDVYPITFNYQVVAEQPYVMTPPFNITVAFATGASASVGCGNPNPGISTSASSTVGTVPNSAITYSVAIPSGRKGSASAGSGGMHDYGNISATCTIQSNGVGTCSVTLPSFTYNNIQYNILVLSSALGATYGQAGSDGRQEILPYQISQP